MRDEVRMWASGSGTTWLGAYVRGRGFGRHSHDRMVIGTVEHGSELIRVGSRTLTVGRGDVVVLNAETVHTGTPIAGSRGWSYRAAYLRTDHLRDLLQDDDPWASRPVVHDPSLARRLLDVHHRAGAGDDRADRLLADVVRSAWREAGGDRPERAEHDEVASRARRVLVRDLVRPPSLDELAGSVGADRYELVRAFGRRYGLPPRAYLNQHRVRRACSLLDAGHDCATTAAAVGFVDQSHLTRHFRKILLATPGQYQRKNVQGAARVRR